MSGTDLPRGNIKNLNIYSLTLSPTAVANATTAEQTFTFQGLNVNDWVDVKSIGTQQAGLSVANSRVSAANTLAVSFTNTTAATITPTASATYLLLHSTNFANPLQTQA